MLRALLTAVVLVGMVRNALSEEVEVAHVFRAQGVRYQKVQFSCSVFLGPDVARSYISLRLTGYGRMKVTYHNDNPGDEEKWLVNELGPINTTYPVIIPEKMEKKELGKLYITAYMEPPSWLGKDDSTVWEMYVIQDMQGSLGDYLRKERLKKEAASAKEFANSDTTSTGRPKDLLNKAATRGKKPTPQKPVQKKQADDLLNDIKAK